MKVVHISTRYPPGQGGVERHVREVVTRLRKRGTDARVITSDLSTEIPWVRLPEKLADETLTVDGVPIHRIRARALSGDLHYPLLPGLFFEIMRDPPDLVHVHTYGTYQGFSAFLADGIGEIPYVITAHYHPTWSIWGGEGRKRLRGVYDRYLARFVLGRASRLILQTREEERLMRMVEPDLPPISFVPPGYTPLPAPAGGGESFRDSYGVEGPYILYVGRLASNKGLDTLVRAFAEVAKTHTEVSLVMVGEDGGSKETVESLVGTLGLSGRVRLVGYVEDEAKLSSAYAGSRMLVLPSEYEAFGLVLLEAMAQGVPVVATRVGGIPQVVEDGENGLLVTPKDVKGLSATVGKLLEDPATGRAMGEYGKQVTVPAYDWEKVVTSLEEIYRAVLKDRRENR